MLSHTARLYAIRLSLEHALKPAPASRVGRVLPAETFHQSYRLISSTTLSSSASSSSTNSTLSSNPESSSHRPISREALLRLHDLSALDPPSPGEEEALSAELAQLIGLMEGVQAVQLPASFEERAELLAEGVGEITLSQESIDQVDRMKRASASSQDEGHAEGVRGSEAEKRGKELLDWATNRVGDYYVSRIKKEA